MLYQTINMLLQARVERERIVFLNFEDERLSWDDGQLDLILQSYREMYPDISLGTCYFFFDEIQNVQGWDRFVRRLYESESQQVFITGSNARMLSTEIATALRGRTITYEVYPLSFREFLTFREITPDIYHAPSKSKLIGAFSDFLDIGGFPEVVLQPDASLRHKTLQEYFNVMLFRDLVEKHKISQVDVLKYFIKRVMATVGSTVSVLKIFRDLKSSGYDVAKNSLYAYLEHSVDIYMIRRLDKFDFSEMKQARSEKKCYPIDQGLFSSLNFHFSKDLGKKLENLVALEFFKMGLNPFYFKQIKECDFIVAYENGRLEAFQVAYEMSDERTRQRELEGLVAACQFIRSSTGTILTMDHSEVLEYKGVQVVVTPVWRWVLEKKSEQV